MSVKIQNNKDCFFSKKRIIEINKIIKSVEKSDYFFKAFIHTSYANENNIENSKTYEVLEFLGDSIINFYTTLYIYKNFPNYTEGKMSKLKQLMIKEDTFSYLSKKIKLNKYLKLGSGEIKNNGINKESILADIFESFLASIYLSKGKKEAWRFLNLTLFFWIKGKEKITWDYKSQLQEYCQSKKNKLQYFSYEEKKNQNSFFFSEATVKDNKEKIIIYKEKGSGRTKKHAEQEAASKIIEKIEKNTKNS